MEGSPAMHPRLAEQIGNTGISNAAGELTPLFEQITATYQRME